MKIAIIGTGISGLVAAHLLHGEHDVTVFEANDYIGGHTNTVEVTLDGRAYAVDTGFIVYNETTYPRFTKLLRQLHVATRPTHMSFSVQSARTGLEYAGTNVNTLFAQRRNLLRPAFHRMWWDILRFNREARALLGPLGQRQTLGAFLAQRRFSAAFVQQYLVPMAAAIWSADPASVYDFPGATFARFFHNHGLLSVTGQPQWRVVDGGSARYVEALTRPFRERIRLATRVVRVNRHETHVTLTPENGVPETYDRVILATHSDQALRLLADPTPAERDVLGAIGYQRNEAVLHTDASLLPRSRRAWAAWNYHVPAEASGVSTVTYNQNILQGLDAPRPLCVTLNRSHDIDPDTVLRRFVYHHPVFDEAAIAAQQRHGEIDGQHRTHFCGAYWGYGFHEDGVNSALAVCRAFGRSL